jgi:hypothetical protein
MTIPEGYEVVLEQAPEGYDIVEPKGITGKVTDFFTGNDRATELTDRLPELSEPNGLFFGEDGGKVAKVIPALLTTLDPQGIQNIITNNFENIGVTYNKDAQGNMFPILRNNKTGAVAQINRPGMSKLDLMQGLGLAAAFTPAGRAGLGTAGTIAGAAKVGLSSAATQAGLSGYQEAVGRKAGADAYTEARGQEPETISTIAKEVGFAGLGGFVFEVLFRAFGPVVKGIFNRAKNGQIDDTTREVFLEQATRLGVDPADVTDDFIRQAANDADQAFSANPEALTALEKEFKVTLSNAQRSGNQAALSADDSLRSGVRGGRAQEAFLKGESAQMDDIIRASSNIQDELGRGAETVAARQQAGSALREGVRNAEQTARSAKDAAYDVVGDAALNAKDFKDVIRQMRRSITGTEFDRTLPETAKLIEGSKGVLKVIDQMGDKIKPYHIKQIEGFRKRINTAYNSAKLKNPSDARQIGIMKQQFDDSLDSAVINGLFQGDETALQSLKQARALNTEYSRQFRNADSKIIQRIVDANPTDEEVINSLFTTSGFNKAGAANLAKSYKTILGDDSEAWNMVRQAAFKNLVKANNEGVISGAKTMTSINKAMELNASLMKEIFSPEELAKIKRFSALVKRAQPELVRSRENPSGTTQKAIKEAGRILPAFLDNGLLTMTGGVWKLAKNRAATNAAKSAFRPFAEVSRGAAESTLEGAAIGQSERAMTGANNLF